KDSDKKIYPADIWPVRAQTDEVVVREFASSPGLASVSTKPAVLVIGSEDKNAYMDVFRAVTRGGFSFDQALLVKGTTKIDDYSLAQLEQFSLVVLHGYSYRRQVKAWGLLREYVRGGGNVFIDTGWQYVAKDWGKVTGGDQFVPVTFFDPLPVTKTAWGEIGTQWEGVEITSQLADGINLADFGPLVWEGQVWGLALAKRGDLQSWAEPVLTKQDQVFMAKGIYGKGKVVWSGMNLLGHALDKENSAEYQFIGNVFEFLLDSGEFEEGEVLINWDDPDRVELTLTKVPSSPAFLYWAETFTPDWKAYLEREGKKEEVKIYPAGPEFRAIPLSNLSAGDKLVMEYSQTKILAISFGVTLMTFLVLLLSICDAALFDQALEKKLKGLFAGRRKVTFEKKDGWLKAKMAALVRWDDEDI
ncbi:hypothetical protein MUP65_01405, partial [Patescibacteria group bacterium]|nr:hypothetical protein [Patescibacteria group bacterium]